MLVIKIESKKGIDAGKQKKPAAAVRKNSNSIAIELINLENNAFGVLESQKADYSVWQEWGEKYEKFNPEDTVKAFKDVDIKMAEIEKKLPNYNNMKSAFDKTKKIIDDCKEEFEKTSMKKTKGHADWMRKNFIKETNEESKESFDDWFDKQIKNVRGKPEVETVEPKI